MEPSERLSAARTSLVLEQPFFGLLALSVSLEVSDAIPTATTNGTRILFNPTFLATLPQAEVIGVMAHEVMHCANGHPWRREQREALRWNVACDLAINPIILAAGLKLPKGCLLDYGVDGKSAEWIYERMPKTKAVKFALDGKAQGAGDGGADVLDGSGDGETDGDGISGGKLAMAEWAERVKQAAEAAKAYGKLPAGCERFVEQATTPRVDWKAALRRFVQMTARDDYSWARVNRRYLSRGFYLPSLHSDTVGPIAVAIDTSGSIDRITLNQFSAELNAIASDVRPTRTHVIYCDAAVHGVDTFEQYDQIHLKPKGGGGTAFGPAIDVAEAFDEAPCCLVYLTDLYGSHRPQPPAMPMLWVTTGQTHAPYGDVVRLE